MSNIKITWVALGYLGDYREQRIAELIEAGYEIKGNASAEFEFETGERSDLELCEKVFRDTNLYSGELWDALQVAIPAERSHTALSIGDKVEIDGRVYVCGEVGFALVA